MQGTDKPQTDTAPKRFSAWRLLPLVVIAGGFVAFFALDLDRFLTFEALRDHRQMLMEWRENNFVSAVLCFIGTYVGTVAFSLPGAVWLTLAGGFLFGTLEGTLCVVIGATLGATTVFLAARYALGDFLRAKAGPSMQKMEAGFQRNAMSYLLILRLVPLFPFWLVNLVPAFLGVPVRTFIVGTFFGIIPGSFVYSSVGNGLGSVFDAGEMPDLGIIFEPQILIPICGLAALSLIPVVYKRFKNDTS